MDNSISMDRMEKTSRISALLMGLGALIVLGALWISYGQLRSLQTEVKALESDATMLRKENRELIQRADAMRNEIGGLREALTASREAIVAFHQRDYGTAVTLYNQALRADPNNAYLLNLKAYSLFKLKRGQDAIDVQRESVRVDPDYAWGYFDLARFQCAAGDFDGAQKSIEVALKKRPALHSTMEKDGEFQRLCAPILK
jgi:tetratricopeptide (TPR) repeat protein